MKRTAHQRTNATGRRIMALAKRTLEVEGALVSTAPNVTVWIPDKRNPGKRIPISTRHDFFGIWDAIVVWPWPAARAFAQFTDLGNIAHRRAKILESGFPCTANDLIMGYCGRSLFRVLRGPQFITQESESWQVPPDPKRTKRRKMT